MDANMSVRWILFDAVGTVIHPDPAAIRVYQQAAQRRGLSLEADQIEVRFRRALQAHFAPDPDAEDPWWTSEERETQRWQSIVADSLPEVFEQERRQDQRNGMEPMRDCFEELWSHFASPAHWRLDPAVPDVWRQLRTRGYRIGIASNFDSRLETICRGLPPLDSADRLFHSALLQTRKPGTRFFRAIEATLGVSNRSAVLVGDDWENDYQAATAAGWTAFWLNRRAVPKAMPAPAASVLTDLRQLPDRLAASAQQQQ